MRIVDKAFAYVTDGPLLLVFRHADFPEAGIQVPAGTIQPGEAPLDAVLREVREESGLEAFLDVRSLGVVEFDARTIGKGEIHRHHFFHLPAAGKPPATWRYLERHGDGPDPFAFDFSGCPWRKPRSYCVASMGGSSVRFDMVNREEAELPPTQLRAVQVSRMRATSQVCPPPSVSALPPRT